MLGGATGDALGFLIEFDNWETIRKKFGPYGLRTVLKLDSNGRRGVISDDTQMALFTADGLLWADHDELQPQEGMYRSYMRWYYTQTEHIVRPEQAQWMKQQPHEQYWNYDLMNDKDLFVRRAPGMTCLSVLSSGKCCNEDKTMNNSKGCGTVMRSAPVGMFYADDPEKAFYVGCQSGSLTHGHPTGYLAAGTMSAAISRLVMGQDFTESVAEALRVLKQYDKHEEVLTAVERGVEEAATDREPHKALERIGAGWVAEEALAAAIYCLIKTATLKDAVIMACNHDGDSDSCGAVCGNLAGAYYGIDAVPKNWTSHLECLDLLEKMADCLCTYQEKTGASQVI
jgi:ADP-ribosylglycohydrolase